MISRFCPAGVLLLVWLAGCQKPDSASPAASPAPASPARAEAPPVVPGWPPTNAQPRLQTMKLFIGPEVITAELALTQVQVATGMMFRKEMGEDEGMLFVFERPHRTGFYMKNTILPLTVAYVDVEGNILELHDLEPLNETPVHSATEQVQFVLEMKQGWFKRHNVGHGAAISTERGRLKDVFRLGP